jgi:hypothetical protein
LGRRGAKLTEPERENSNVESISGQSGGIQRKEGAEKHAEIIEDLESRKSIRASIYRGKRRMHHDWIRWGRRTAEEVSHLEVLLKIRKLR